MSNPLTRSIAGVALAVAMLLGVPRASLEDGAKLDALIDRYIKLRRDGSGSIPSSAAQRAKTFRGLKTELESIPHGQLSPEQQIDRLALKGQIAGTLHELEDLRPWERNPEAFIQFGGVASALAEDAPAAA